MIENNETKYGEEIRAICGNENVDKSNRKILNMTENQLAEAEKLSAEITAALAESVATGDPGCHPYIHWRKRKLVLFRIGDKEMEKVIIINNEFMGTGSQELGTRLMTVFLHKLMLAQVKPEAIILYNSGVNIAVNGTATAEALAVIADENVQILACVTCVEYYKIENKLKGARITNMGEISSILFQAETVITL